MWNVLSQEWTRLIHGETATIFWRDAYILSAVAWCIAYVMTIRDNYRTKTCAMPILGITSIFVQCFIQASFGPYWRPDLFPHNPYFGDTYGVVWLWRIWLLLQGIVLYQYFKYQNNEAHGADVTIRGVSKTTLVVSLLVLNLFCQWTFIVYFHDQNVNTSDPVAYLFLAIGWIVLAMNRPNHIGLSYKVAWIKFVSTAIIFITPYINPLVGFGTMLVQPDEMVDWQLKANCQGENPKNCDLMAIICEGSLTPPSTTAPAHTIDYSNCPKPRGATIDAGDFAAQLLKRQRELEANGWRIAGFTSVYSTQYGDYELVRTRQKPKDMPPPSRTVSHGQIIEQASWGEIWQCVAHPVEKRSEPVWDVQPIKYSLLSCVDGRLHLNYQFPVLAMFLCVFFDGIYVYVLWQGRRRRRLTV